MCLLKLSSCRFWCSCFLFSSKHGFSALSLSSPELSGQSFILYLILPSPRCPYIHTGSSWFPEFDLAGFSLSSSTACNDLFLDFSVDTFLPLWWIDGRPTSGSRKSRESLAAWFMKHSTFFFLCGFVNCRHDLTIILSVCGLITTKTRLTAISLCSLMTQAEPFREKIERYDVSRSPVLHRAFASSIKIFKYFLTTSWRASIVTSSLFSSTLDYKTAMIWSS